MKDYQTPALLCWHCRTELDGHMRAHGDGEPKEGDVSICIYCGAWGFFALTEVNKALFLREPTTEEWFDITTDRTSLMESMLLVRFREENDLSAPDKK